MRVSRIDTPLEKKRLRRGQAGSSVKGAVRSGAARLGTRWPQPRRSAVTVLLYHRVDDTPAVNSVSTATFARQMHWLDCHRDRWPVLGLDEALARLIAGTAPQRSVVVTFDDGHADTLEEAVPLLVASRVPATVYVPTGLIGVAGRLTREQVCELASAGVTVGSHSHSHPDLRRCSDTELDRELRSSRADLEDLLGRPVHSFAYPFGHADARVRTACRAAGYENAASASRGWLVAATDRFALPRQIVENFGMATFEAVVRGGLNVLVPADRLRDALVDAVTRRRSRSPGGGAH